jgi:dolichol-phosphate mannosyltransferase
MKVIAMIPTYNEAANIGLLLDDLMTIADLEAVVVDDSSPDGTAAVVRTVAARRPGRVHLIVRTGRRGRGAAGVEGFRRALDLGATHVVEMDADLSHPARYVPALVEAARGADVVLASRLVAGGGEINRSIYRIFVTKAANLLTRKVMGYPVHDCTSGFRLFRREVLEAIDLGTLTAEGPAIVGEVLYRALRAGFRAVEVPFIYEDRRFGASSLKASTLIDCLVWLGRLKIRQRTVDRAAWRR